MSEASMEIRDGAQITAGRASDEEIVQRADLALSDLSSNGGLLNVEQNNTFIRNLIDQPTLLRQVRTIPMNSPSVEINKIGFGKRILRAATQTPQANRALPDEAIEGVFDPNAEKDARFKPQTSKITLSTSETIAEIRIPYEVLEDNIERGSLQTTILALIGERAALDLEELVIQGDTSVSGTDPYLGMQDGVLKLVTSNVYDAAGGSISASVFNSVVKALPTKYRRNRALMRLYVPMDVEQDYRLQLSNRGTGLGDAVLTGNAPVPVFGIPMNGAALMPATNIVFTNPQNIIFGIQRNIRLESERMISERLIKIVLTARIAIQIEEEEAAVKVINLG